MTSDPFLKALKDDIAARNAEVPKGYRKARPSETGVHFKPEDAHLNARISALKPANTPEGHAVWEKQALETLERVTKEGDAVLVLVMAGKKIGTPEHRQALKDWREGKLELPTLADTLGMKPVNNQQATPRAPVERRETNEQLESRLARQREEIRERVNTGLARVKATGKTKSGNAIGRPKVSTKTESAIRKALQAGGVGIRKLAVQHGVGTGTVQRIKAAMIA